MVTLPLIPPSHVWTLVALVAVMVLYGVVCFIQALHTPPDAWTEINEIGGFPKRKK